MWWVEFQVVKGWGAGIGWESVLQETTWFESDCVELSCSLWQIYTHTHTKQSRHTKLQHLQELQIHTTPPSQFQLLIFLLVLFEINFNTLSSGDSSVDRFQREMERENSRRRDKLSERMRERRRIKRKRTEELVLLISSAWSYVVNVFFCFFLT